jgi:6-phosphofructokinase 1
MITPGETRVLSLGEGRYASPLLLNTVDNDLISNYVKDEARIRYALEVAGNAEPGAPEVLFEKAGPRARLFFNPRSVRAAMVTCGGLCPGLNNVLRSAFLELHHNYGVSEVLGVRYGFQGLNPAEGLPPIRLTAEFVDRIHEDGGTALGSSRGPQQAAVMVDYLEQQRIDMLFCVGGEGTQRGAHYLFEEVQRRSLPIAVVGIPKTIDNDILYVSRTFGFSTALEKAREVLECAHVEARGALYGIGLVKVMGRDAGFIAAGATQASQQVNFTLIPEVPFALEGENGFLNCLHRRLLERRHAVIAVAEGAGKDLLADCPEERDASGNVKRGDIGLFLRDRIGEYFKRCHLPVQMKYIDPSYIIRSVPANSDDSILCDQLARNAVHAAMAGKTDVMIGLWHEAFIHVPIALATAGKKQVSPESDLWRGVLAATGQPPLFR